MTLLELEGLSRRVSPVALGTAVLGAEISRDESLALLDAFMEAGGNQIDTANVYASWIPGRDGCSETTIGEWLRDRGTREQVILGTKGGHYAWTEERESRMNIADLSHDLVQSLDRLRTDHVDIYWFHRDNPSIPLSELFGWAAEQKTAGRIGTIGVSNWTPARVREATVAARTAGLSSLFGSQVGWSLAKPRSGHSGDPTLVHMDDEGIALHSETRLPVYAFNSQAQGYFSHERRESPRLAERYDTPGNRELSRRVDSIAANHAVPPTRVALAWLMTRPFPVVPIIGPRDAAQLRDSIAAFELELTPGEIQSLDHFPRT